MIAGRVADVTGDQVQRTWFLAISFEADKEVNCPADSDDVAILDENRLFDAFGVVCAAV